MAAPVDRVWALVTDVDLPARFSREFQGGEWLDEPGPGATFRGHNRIGDMEWSTTCTVVDFRPGEAFTWVVESVDEPVATWGYTLDGPERRRRPGHARHTRPGDRAHRGRRPPPTRSTRTRSSPDGSATGRRT